MKKRNLRLRRLSMLIAFLMLIVSMPFTIQAMAMETTENVVEVEEYREEYTKHFLMPDGTYKAVTYDAPVHRMDENGVWQDIDNTMSEKAVKNKQAYITSDERAIFSKKINETDNTVFELNENGYSIKLSFVDDDIKNTSAKLSNHAKKYEPQYTDDIETQYKKLKEIDNNTTVTYKNVLKGVDLEYILSANDIKENIIITKKCDEYSYTFRYELSGLGARLNEDGSVSLYDINSNAEKYSIPAPYMYDDAGEVSYDVAYTLNELGGSIYELTVTANEEWINASEREFPVTVDPTVSATANAYDTYIDADNPNTNYASATNLLLSSNDIVFMDILGNTGKMPTLPGNASITFATLNLYYYFYVENGNVSIGVYPTIYPWTDTTLTWNSANQYTNLGISNTSMGGGMTYARPNMSSSSPDMAIFNITELAEHWYMGMTNYGVALKYEGGSNSSVIIKSREAGTATLAYYEVAYILTTVPISNGTYFMKNGDFYDNYMQLNDTVGHNHLEAFSFDGDDDQKWIITYLYNGYYKIVSADNGLAATVPTSTSANQGIIAATWNYDFKQQWKITEISSSADCVTVNISSRERPSFYLAAGDGVLTDNGRNIEQRTARSDSKDEWYMYLENEFALATLPIRIYYDQSIFDFSFFNVANENQKTAQQIENERKLKLQNLFEEAAEGIWENFYVKFEIIVNVVNNEAKPFIEASPLLELDPTCTAGDKYQICNSGCGNVENCATLHHRASIRLLEKLQSETEYTCRFVGYKICSYNSVDGHRNVLGTSLVATNRDIVVSLIGLDTTDASIDERKNTIQHELSHTLGADDDACTNTNSACVMNKEATVSQWCSNCKNTIREYIKYYVT